MDNHGNMHFTHYDGIYDTLLSIYVTKNSIDFVMDANGGQAEAAGQFHHCEMWTLRHFIKDIKDVLMSLDSRVKKFDIEYTMLFSNAINNSYYNSDRANFRFTRDDTGDNVLITMYVGNNSVYMNKFNIDELFFLLDFGYQNRYTEYCEEEE